MSHVKRLLGDTKNAVLAVGALAGAVVAVYSAGNVFMSIGSPPHTTPLALGADFKHLSVRSEVGLQEYEGRNQTVALSGAPAGPRAQAVAYRLTAGTASASASASARPEIALAAVSAGPPATGSTTTASSPKTADGLGSSSSQGTTTEKEKEETVAEKEAKIKEETEVEEEAEKKAKEEAEAREAKAAKEKKEAKETREEAKEKAKEKAEAAAGIKKKEEEKKKEEKANSHSGSSSNSHKSQGHHGHAHPAFANPPAPATEFHHEGHALVLDGTGASTSAVNAVLAKVHAIFSKSGVGISGSASNGSASTASASNESASTESAETASASSESSSTASASTASASNESPSTEGASTFGMTDAVFDEPATGEPASLPVAAGAAGADGETAVTKPALPTHCDQSCAVKQTIDQAIADSDSNLAEAARKIAAVFTHSRGRVFDHKLEPVGAIVSYSIDLVGFTGHTAILEWTLEPEGQGNLPSTWWHKVIVKQVRPSRPEEPTLGHFWAPIPPTRGNYVFHLTVFDGKGVLRGEEETKVFH